MFSTINLEYIHSCVLVLFCLCLHIIVYHTAVPNQVHTLFIDAVTLEDDIMNYNITLSWGEPFSNFDPIVNYTVMCSGDDQCPDNFTTTDNTTRSYTITNLTSMATYTFSVVATNSIGSGEAAVLLVTAPSCECYICTTLLKLREVQVHISRV